MAGNRYPRPTWNPDTDPYVLLARAERQKRGGNFISAVVAEVIAQYGDQVRCIPEGQQPRPTRAPKVARKTTTRAARERPAASKWGKDTPTRIVELCKTATAWTEVAAALGVSPSTLSDWRWRMPDFPNVKPAGVPAKKDTRGRPRLGPNAAQMATYQQMNGSGASFRAICQAMGVADSTGKYWISRQMMPHYSKG
jgi:transposase-like protein